MVMKNEQEKGATIVGNSGGGAGEGLSNLTSQSSS